MFVIFFRHAFERVLVTCNCDVVPLFDGRLVAGHQISNAADLFFSILFRFVRFDSDDSLRCFNNLQFRCLERIPNFVFLNCVKCNIIYNYLYD